MKLNQQNNSKYTQANYSLISTSLVCILFLFFVNNLIADTNKDKEFVYNTIKNTTINSKPIQDSLNYNDYIIAYNQGALDAKKDSYSFLLSISGFTVSLFLNKIGSLMVVELSNGVYPKNIPNNLNKEGYRDGYFLMLKNIHNNVARGSTSIGSFINSTLILLFISFLFALQNLDLNIS